LGAAIGSRRVPRLRAALVGLPSTSAAPFRLGAVKEIDASNSKKIRRCRCSARDHSVASDDERSSLIRLFVRIAKCLHCADPLLSFSGWLGLMAHRLRSDQRRAAWPVFGELGLATAIFRTVVDFVVIGVAPT